MKELVSKLEDVVEDERDIDEGCSSQSAVPIWRKTTLTVREAAAYSNIGINRIENLLKQPTCAFVLWVGTKKLVKRKAFEEYLENVLEI